MPKLAALLALSPALNALMAPVDPAWEAALVKVYVDSAKNGFANWYEKAKAGLAAGEDKAKVAWGEHRHEPSFLTWNQSMPRVRESYAGIVAAVESGAAVSNLEKAESYAKQVYQEQRACYLSRLGEKIYECIGMSPVVSITGNLSYGREITGQVSVQVSEGNQFLIDATTKTNYRYGDNAANRVMTVYSQYPFKIVRAVIKGTLVLKPGVDAVAAAFGGWTREKKAKITDEIKSLTEQIKRKMVQMEGLASMRSYPDKVEKYEQRNGIKCPGDAKACLALQKVLKAEREALKEQVADLRAEAIA